MNGRELIAWLLSKIPKIGGWLTRRYNRLWNPANYALVGFLGVLINMGVWAMLVVIWPWAPWYLINSVAIIIAWLHNWAFSVGPLGWFWGFKKRPQS